MYPGLPFSTVRGRSAPVPHEDAGGLLVGIAAVFQFQFVHAWVSFPEYLLTMRCWKSPGLQVCEADEEGDLVGLVQSVPNGADEAVNVPFHGHLLRLSGKGGQGIAVSGVGVEEVAGPRLAGILEGLPQAASAGPVGGFQDGQLVTAVGPQQPGNPRGPVGTVRLEFPRAEGLLHGKALL